MQNTIVPLIKISDSLVVPIQVELTDVMVEQLQNDILMRLRETAIKKLLIDVSAVEVIDSFIARSIINTARMAKLMDAKTVVIGIAPEVALTLVEMGFSWPGVWTAMSVEHAMAILKE
jgi:rsbT antagonist protein RsbS